jgi:import inner membrane translocase subunit TIM44
MKFLSLNPKLKLLFIYLELFDIKQQLDESDNPAVRVARVLTDKFSSIFGGVFKSTELSEVLTEIIKMEPTFELHEFLKRVQYDIIPNILESLSQHELEILKDWCTEAVRLNFYLKWGNLSLFFT